MRTIKYILLGLAVLSMMSLAAQPSKSQKGKKSNSNWVLVGPNNIAGRALSICVDRNNSQVLYAGTAGSGIWKSTNAGNTWIRLTNFHGSAAVSAIVQDNNGTIYIGTGDGLNHDAGGGFSSPKVSNHYNNFGIKGDGVYTSSDGGSTFTKLTATQDWEEVNSMAYDAINNKLYVATEEGLKVSNNGGTSFSNASSLTNKCVEVKVDKNNTVIFTNYSSAAGAYVSTDGGASFTSVTGTASNKLPNTAGRISMAISPTDANMLYALTADADGAFSGVFQSRDKGTTWRSIAPVGGLIDPIGSQNGIYCNQIEVDLEDSSIIYLGGAHLYSASEWSTSNNFSFTTISSSVYLFDILLTPEANYFCTMNGILKDGVYKNNYLASMQAQTLAIANDGRFMSGIKNGAIALLEDPTSPSKRAIELATPTGIAGSGAFSSVKPEALYYNGYYGYCYRRASVVSDAQEPSDWMIVLDPDGSKKVTTWLGKDSTTLRWHRNSNHLTNNTAIANVNPILFWESYNDKKSIDSVDFIIDKTYAPGDYICVKSQRNNYPIWYQYNGTDTLKRHVDTITIQDVVTSRFFLGGGPYRINNSDNIGVGAPVFMSQTALDYLNAPYFNCVFRTRDTTEQVMDLKVSKNGNSLFVLTRKGNNSSSYSIYRVDGFDDYRAEIDIEVSDAVFNAASGFTANNAQRKLTDNVVMTDFTGADILSISLSNDDNTIIFTTNGDGVGIYRVGAITDAGTATNGLGTVVYKDGTGLPEEIAIYSALMEMSDDNLVFIGTEEGVYKTENFSATDPTWVLDNDGINVKVPVFSIQQQTKLWPTQTSITYAADGSSVETVYPGTTNYGNIYVATSGLGIFVDSTYYNSIGENKIEIKENEIGMTVYPNPTNGQATLDFVLNNESNVNLSIVDITGRTIINKNIGQMVAGSHRQHLDCTNFANGIYFVHIRANNIDRTLKLIISK